jgi:hypothetical protein
LSQATVAIGVNIAADNEGEDEHGFLFFQLHFAFQVCLFYQRIFKLIKKSIVDVVLKLMLSQLQAGERD